MSIKTDIQNQIKQQIRASIAANQPIEKTPKGFFTGLKEDMTSFGKGVLGLGREAVLHPIESAKTVGSTAFEIAKQTGKAIPSFVNQAGDIIMNPIDTTKELIQNYKALRAIPYRDQKKIFSDLSEKAIAGAEGRGQKVLAAIGSGLIEDISEEITHPMEFAYEKPFTFGLDVLSFGGGKLLTKGTKIAAQPLKSTKFVKGLEDLFVPNAKLKRAGFRNFSNDLMKTNTNIFNAQKNIIRSTSQKFEKEFGLNATRRLEFFETIDKLRRAKVGVKATSPNAKVQKAIDWWLDLEVPKIQRAAKLPKEKSITNYLHHFFPEKIISAERAAKPFKIREGFLKKSKDVAGFSKDPIVSISAIKSKLATNALKDSFIARTARKYGQKIENLEAQLIAKIGSKAVDGAKEAGRLKEVIKKNLDVDFFSPKKGVEHILPKTIADEINKFYGLNSLDNTVKKLLTPLDVFNRNWKPLATAVRPRYHTRNVVGNLYNSIIIGGMNIKNIPTAAKQQLGHYINEVRGMKNTAGTIAKKIFPTKFDTKLIDQAIKEDVLGRGFFSMDLHDLAEAAKNSDDIIKVINKVKNPAEIYRIPVLRQYLNLSNNIGKALEDNARLSLYIDRVNKGFTKQASKEYVNKHLFDYLTGLGEADKIIKKLIPFWSWQRFNIPLQSETLFTKPVRNLVIQRGGQPFVEEVERFDENIPFFTDEEREQGLLKVSETEQNGQILDKYIRTQSVLPQSDLVRLVDMFKLDFSDIGANPLFSLFNRLKNNRNYWGKQIERFTGERVKFLGTDITGRQKEMLSIIPFLNELNKGIGGSFIEGKKPNLPIRLEQVLSPLGTTLKDRENVKFFGILEKEQELKGSYEAGLESLYKRYLIKSTDNPEEKAFKKNVENLEKLLKKKGLTDLDLLPMKIKAMKESIRDKIKKSIKENIRKNKEGKEENPDDVSLLKKAKGIFGIKEARAATLEDDSKQVKFEKPKSTARILGEDLGILTDPKEPLSKLPLKEKVKLIAKSVAEEVGGSIEKKKAPFVYRVVGEILKLPITTLYSLADIPGTIIKGKPQAQGFDLPKGVPTLSGSKVSTFFKQLENKLNKGEDPKAALAEIGFKSILGVTQIASLAQGIVNKFEKSPSLKIIDQKQLKPKMVESRLNDVALKVSRIKGSKNMVPLGKKILNLKDTTLKNVDSPGQFFREVAKVIKSDPGFDPRMMSKSEGLAGTTHDFYLGEAFDIDFIRLMEKKGKSPYINVSE